MNSSEKEPQRNPMQQPATLYTQKNLPNAVPTLVLGICSILPGCFCFGVIGVVCGIIALVFASKDLNLYQSDPNAYTLSSLNNVKAGRVCAIVGLCLSALVFLFYVFYFVILGTAISMIPWDNM